MKVQDLHLDSKINCDSHFSIESEIIEGGEANLDLSEGVFRNGNIFEGFENDSLFGAN